MTGSGAPGAYPPTGRGQMFLFVAGLLSTLVLLASFVLALGFPDHLALFHLDARSVQLVHMDLVSFILLLAWLQRNPSPTWRTLTLAGAFIVLAESCLMAIT